MTADVRTPVWRDETATRRATARGHVRAALAVAVAAASATVVAHPVAAVHPVAAPPMPSIAATAYAPMRLPASTADVGVPPLVLAGDVQAAFEATLGGPVWASQRDEAGTPGGGWGRAVAPVGGEVLRGFDPPETPYGRGHRGVDLAVAQGQPVRAALAGVVRFAGPVGGRPWVTVEHAGGLATTYGGVDPGVAAGDRVALGDQLGVARDQGWIDWGARYSGAYIDPLGLLGGWTARLVE